MTGDRQRLAIHRDASRSALFKWIGRSRWMQRGISVFGVIAGPVLLGFASGMSGNLHASDGNGLTWKGLILFGGAVLAIIGGILNLVAQEATSDALIRAEELDGEAQGFLDQRDQLLADAVGDRALDERRLALIEAARTMLETAATAMGTEGLSIEDRIEMTLRAARRALIAAIDFERDEYWVVSIFRCDGDLLKRIFAIRADPAEEQADGRSWRRGEGFVGMAWLREAEVIVSDCNNTEVSSAYVVPEPNRLATDPERYKAMAVVPVRIGPNDRFWGAVAVSSDRIGRFKRNPGDRRAQNVDTVRLMALAIELLVTAHEARSTPTIADDCQS